MAEHRRLEEIAAVDFVERDLREDVGADGDEAVVGIEAVPVAGRGLGEETERDIAEAAKQRHRADGLQVAEAVSLRVIGRAVDQRLHELRDEPERHLPVAVDFHDDVRARFERVAEAGDHRPADALILLVADDDDARIDLRVALRHRGRVVGRAVVDDDDGGEERRHRAQHVRQLARDVERRHDRGDMRRRARAQEKTRDRHRDPTCVPRSITYTRTCPSSRKTRMSRC